MRQRLLHICLAAALLTSACTSSATIVGLPDTAEAPGAGTQTLDSPPSASQEPGEQFLLPLPANRVPAPAIGQPPAGTERFASSASESERIAAAYVPETEFARESYFHGEVSKVDVIELNDGGFATTSPAQIRIWDRGDTEPSAVVDAGSGVTWPATEGRIGNVGIDGQLTQYYQDLSISTAKARASWTLDEIHSVLRHPDGRGVHVGVGFQDDSVVFWSLGSPSNPLNIAPIEPAELWGTAVGPLLDYGFGIYLQEGGRKVHAVDMWNQENVIFRTSQHILRLNVLPDGRLITPYENGLDVWDMNAPEEPLHLAGPTNFTDFVVDLPNGTLATASNDDVLYLWDLDQPSSPLIASVPMPHDDGMRDIAALADGRVVTMGYDRYVHVWDPADLSTPALTFELDEQLQRVEQLSDGRLAVLALSGTLYLWNLDTPGAPTVLETGSAGVILDFGLFADGTIYTANEAGVVQLFSGVDEQIPTSDNRWHTQKVSDLLWLTDGRLISTGAEGETFLWDLTGQRPPIDLIGHEQSISMITEHRGSVVSASADGTIRQWDLRTGSEIVSIETGQPILAAQVLPDGAVATSAPDGTLRIFRLDDALGVPLAVSVSGTAIHEMRLLSDGRMLTANRDHELTVWNTNSWQPAFNYSDHDSAITAMAELADGRLVTGDEDGAAHVWDPSRELPPLVASSMGAIRTIDVVGPGRFVSATGEGVVTEWDMSAFQSPTQVDGMTAAIALDDGRIVGAEADTIRSWIDPGPVTGRVTDLVTLPAAVDHLEAYDSQRLAVASGTAVIIIDISE